MDAQFRRPLGRQWRKPHVDEDVMEQIRNVIRRRKMMVAAFKKREEEAEKVEEEAKFVTAEMVSELETKLKDARSRKSKLFDQLKRVLKEEDAKRRKALEIQLQLQQQATFQQSQQLPSPHQPYQQLQARLLPYGHNRFASGGSGGSINSMGGFSGGSGGGIPAYNRSFEYASGGGNSMGGGSDRGFPQLRDPRSGGGQSPMISAYNNPKSHYPPSSGNQWGGGGRPPDERGFNSYPAYPRGGRWNNNHGSNRPMYNSGNSSNMSPMGQVGGVGGSPLGSHPSSPAIGVHYHRPFSPRPPDGSGGTAPVNPSMLNPQFPPNMSHGMPGRRDYRGDSRFRPY